jgi:hypothetical protein
MLLSHISFFLGLIALVFGVALYLWSVRAESGPGITLAKSVGVIVIVLSILDLICTVYSGMRMRHFYREMRQEHCPMNPAPANSPPVASQPVTPAPNPTPANSAQ